MHPVDEKQLRDLFHVRKVPCVNLHYQRESKSNGANNARRGTSVAKIGEPI
jgi:hypothetical protein